VRCVEPAGDKHLRHRQVPKEETITRNRFGLGVFGVVAILTTLVAGQASHGQAQNGTPTDPCAMTNLPAGIQNKLTTKYAGWKIVTPALLHSLNPVQWTDAKDWSMSGGFVIGGFSGDRSKTCPGMVAGKFSDDNQTGYFVNLIRRQNGKTWQRVLYFHPNADGFSVETVVVPSRIKPADDAEVEIEKMPREMGLREYHIKTDSMVMGESLIYYWRQGRLKKIVIDVSDDD
jgi:hypothetical protein